MIKTAYDFGVQCALEEAGLFNEKTAAGDHNIHEAIFGAGSLPRFASDLAREQKLKSALSLLGTAGVLGGGIYAGDVLNRKINRSNHPIRTALPEWAPGYMKERGPIWR